MLSESCVAKKGPFPPKNNDDISIFGTKVADICRTSATKLVIVQQWEISACVGCSTLQNNGKYQHVWGALLYKVGKVQ